MVYAKVKADPSTRRQGTPGRGLRGVRCTMHSTVSAHVLMYGGDWPIFDPVRWITTACGRDCRAV